jgi:hypothetical protein
MELGGSLPLTQLSSSGPYAEPDESTPFHSIQFRKLVLFPL